MALLMVKLMKPILEKQWRLCANGDLDIRKRKMQGLSFVTEVLVIYICLHL